MGVVIRPCQMYKNTMNDLAPYLQEDVAIKINGDLKVVSSYILMDLGRRV